LLGEHGGGGGRRRRRMPTARATASIGDIHHIQRV
jgi:hypothetical protein